MITLEEMAGGACLMPDQIYDIAMTYFFYGFYPGIAIGLFSGAVILYLAIKEGWFDAPVPD